MNDATIDQATFDRLEKAYLATEYQVMLELGEHLVLRVGESCPGADEVLARDQVTCAAFITPENPWSKALSDIENYSRCVAFEKVLATAGFRYLRGTGQSLDRSWPGENSFFILGVDETHATKLARSFGQNAFIMYDRGAVARLVWCVSVCQ